MKVSQKARDACAKYLKKNGYPKDMLEYLLNPDSNVDAWEIAQTFAAFEQSIRDKALQEAAGIAETYSWQDGKMTENSCCAATGCDIAAAIRQMKGEG